MRSSPDFSEFPPNLWVVFSIQVGSFEVVLPMKEVIQVTPLLWKKEEKLRVLKSNPFISKKLPRTRKSNGMNGKMDDDYGDEFLKLD